MRGLWRLNPETSLVTFGTTDGPDLSSERFPYAHLQSVTDRTLREAYCQSGAFLLPSRHEGLGLTALEAMACQCPVVLTDARGNYTFSRHGKTCLVGHGPDELAWHLGRSNSIARWRIPWAAKAGRNH
jgi:glycosyltransferase involved in cell wall biosynthesis